MSDSPEIEVARTRGETWVHVRGVSTAPFEYATAPSDHDPAPEHSARYWQALPENIRILLTTIQRKTNAYELGVKHHGPGHIAILFLAGGRSKKARLGNTQTQLASVVDTISQYFFVEAEVPAFDTVDLRIRLPLAEADGLVERALKLLSTLTSEPVRVTDITRGKK